MTKLLCENGVDATIHRWATSQRTSKCIVPTWQGPYLRGLALQECERNVRPTFTAGCTGITHAFVSSSMKSNPYSFVYSWSWHKASAHWIYDCNVDGDTAHRFRSISYKPRESSGGEAIVHATQRACLNFDMPPVIHFSALRPLLEHPFVQAFMLHRLAQRSRNKN